MKLNGTLPLLVYAFDVNKLDGSVHNMEKNTEALVVVTKDIGLEVTADKTEYLVMSGDQNAGRSHNIDIGTTSSSEKVEELKYLGSTLTNQISIQEEIKGRLKSGNACYHSVQNLSSSCILPKNIKNRI